MYRINLLLMLFAVLMIACSEDERWQYAIDNIAPGQVSNVVVENVAGGAIITYTTPNDDDLLYVKVVYQMSDGSIVEQKSSAYTPKIVVEGLGVSKKQTVQLICGDRSGNESTPYLVDIEPMDAPIYEVQKSINIEVDFGGIRITWDNPLRANIVLTIYVLDENNNFIEVQNVYSNSSTGRFSLRGFPSEETTFAVSLRDRWENKTDMLSGTFTPLFEEQLDRLKFGRWNPPGIPYIALGGWDLQYIWNGLLTNPGYSTSWDVTLPHSITFNLGQMAQLNRIKVFQRWDPYPYVFSGYNVKRFQLWASPHPNVTQDFATWLFLGDFTSEKPSGLPLGQVTEEDIAYALEGEDYIIENNNTTPVQYIRIHILETFDGGVNIAQLLQVEFYGQIEK